MDRREDAHWRRVPGSRAIWTVGRRPPSTWEAARMWAWSSLKAIAAIAYALRGFVARFLRSQSKWRIRLGAAPPRRRHRV
jgi:hypothetical protein